SLVSINVDSGTTVTSQHSKITLSHSKNRGNLPGINPPPKADRDSTSQQQRRVSLANSIVKQPFLKALLLTSGMLWSHWCQSETGGRVTLAIARSNTDAILSWPYPSRGFGLEFATNLATTNWQPATGTSVSNSGRWEVTAPAGQPSGFFRLKNHLQYFGFWAGSVAAGGSIIEQRGTVNFTMGAGP